MKKALVAGIMMILVAASLFSVAYAAPDGRPSVSQAPSNATAPVGPSAAPVATPVPQATPAALPAARATVVPTVTPAASPAASPATTPSAAPSTAPQPVASPAASPAPVPGLTPVPTAPPGVNLPAVPGVPSGPFSPTTPGLPGATLPARGPGGEQPTIKAIEVEGNVEVPTADILQVVTSRIGEPADKDRIQRDLQNIYDMGFFTDVKPRTEPFLNGVRVVYHVLENPKVTRIDIQGNKIVPTDKLRSLMETREGKILNTKTLFADITVINRYYDNELGYLLEPTHITNLKFSPEGLLHMDVTEGVVVHAIKIAGNTVIPSASLTPLVKMKAGALFNQFVMKEDADRLSKYYEKRDFILDNIRPSINKLDGVVTYQVIEATVEDIRIEGNTHTRAYVIKRLMRTKVGMVLKRKRLQRDLERLNSSGFFETVNIEPEPGAESGHIVLVLKVKEQKTGMATLGLGYSGGGTGAVRSGITGAVSFSERDLNGRGQSASIQWQRGVNIDSYGVNYLDPAINDAQDSLGFSFFHSSFQELQQPVTSGTNIVYALYDDTRTGGSVTYGKYLSDDLRAFLTLKREYIKTTMDPNSQFVPIGLGVGDCDSATISAISDTRDDLFNPHHGSYTNAAVSFAGGPLGGQFDYTKFQLELRHYIPIFRDHTIALRAWGGVANGTLPVSEIFYVGGVDTLRAYQDNAFMGSRFVVANAEYRFPIANLKILNGAVFTDAGGAWFAGQQQRIWKDFGVGLRIVFPSLGLGVIRLDYAFGETGSRSSIGLGQTF